LRAPLNDLDPADLAQLEDPLAGIQFLARRAQEIAIVRGEAAKGKLVIERPDMTLEELEREYILKVLQYTGWQKKRASEILGINASTLYRKLQTYKGEGHLGGMEEIADQDEPTSFEDAA
jgi:DNA-binding NtrC family response regulator